MHLVASFYVEPLAYPAVCGSHLPYKFSSQAIRDPVGLQTRQLLVDLFGGHLRTRGNDNLHVSNDRIQKAGKGTNAMEQ